MKSLTVCALIISAFLLMACQQAGKPSRDTSIDSNQAPANAAHDAVTTAELVGVWYVEYIGERPVIDRSPARIQFTEDGTINGNSSCNRFFGSYSYGDGQLKIPANLGATKMMCLPALMEQEQRLFQHLPEAVQASMSAGLLILRDVHGSQIIKASRDESL